MTTIFGWWVQQTAEYISRQVLISGYISRVSSRTAIIRGQHFASLQYNHRHISQGLPLGLSVKHRCFRNNTAMPAFISCCAVFLSLSLACLTRLTSSGSTPSSLEQYKSIGYLSQYGYLVSKDPRTGDLRSAKELVNAIKIFQRYATLPETGKLDAATIAKMGESRCGVPDFGPGDNARRKRRYNLQGTYWKKRDLTYKIRKFTAQLTQDKQRKAFKRAFGKWAALTPLTIQEANNKNDEDVDILISFDKGVHKDGYPFDGAGGTLAHAFYPHNNKGLSGDAHFDDAERFTIGRKDGINLDWVAIHEFGHSLGMEHSGVKGSIMYPWYQGYHDDIQLTDDDVTGIQELYGAAATKPTENAATNKNGVTVATPTKLPEENDVCGMSSYNTFFMGTDGKTYAFKGDKYWIIASKSGAGLESGPYPINSKWKELKTPVDAAYTINGGSRTFFFRGSEFYEYYYSRLRRGPRPISELGLPAELNNMDAVFTWGRNTKTYFFKGGQYWRYYNNKIDYGYPKSISAWGGIPSSIDAVMKWRNGKTYFFKGREYYRLDDWEIHAEADYPKRIALKWMKCEKEDMRGVTLEPETSEPEKTGNCQSRDDATSSAQTPLPSTLLTLLVPLIFFKLW